MCAATSVSRDIAKRTDTYGARVDMVAADEGNERLLATVVRDRYVASFVAGGAVVRDGHGIRCTSRHRTRSSRVSPRGGAA